MAVTSDNVSTISQADSSTQQDTTLVIAASANCITALTNKTSGNTLTVVLDPAGVNQAFTRQVNAADVGGTETMEMWALINPSTTGSKTVRVTQGSASNLAIQAQSWIGADNSSLANCIHNTNTHQAGSSADASVATPGNTTTGSIVISGVISPTQGVVSIPFTDLGWLVDQSASNGNASYTTGTGSVVTFSWTLLNPGNSGSGIMEIMPGTATPAPLMGQAWL